MSEVPLSPRSGKPSRGAPSSAAFALLALLAGVAVLPGCHNAPNDSAPLSAIRVQNDALPAGLPAASPLFASVSAPAHLIQIDHAALPPKPPDAGQAALEAVQAPPTSPSARNVSAIADKPAQRNSGLLVCDPVSALSAPPALVNFGIGCGHWLHLIAAGQPGLGRTPSWDARKRVEYEMKRADLRLTLSDTAPLATMAGVTHVACGTLSGTAARCTLTYQLYTLPDRHPVGAPLTKTGSWRQVAAALPSMARGIDARLGIATAQVPASPALSPGELTLLGGQAHAPASTDADLQVLAKMSAHSPLAGFFLLQTRAIKDQIVLDRTVKMLLAQLPQNTLALSEIGYQSPTALRPYAASNAAFFLRFPGNALLAHTEAWEQRVWGTRTGELRAVQRAVAASPQDPDSWLSPAQTLSNIAEDLRQGRFASDLSPREWSYLNRLYAQAQGCTENAVRLDPKDGHAWCRLAQAAAFAGDSARAANAFRQAETLDPNPSEVDAWGLQMFQPKWRGDPAALDQVVVRAAARRYDDADSAIEIAVSLQSVGIGTSNPRYAALSAEIMSRLVAQDRAQVAKDQADVMAHWDLAAALAYSADPVDLRESTQQYRIAAHLLPNSPQLHYWLANTLSKRHKGREEIAELRQAIALDPFYTRAHFDLGYSLKHVGQFAEALTELRLAMRLDPRDPRAHYGLGDLLQMQHRPALAAAQYSEAARMFPYFTRAWGGLCFTLDQTGRYDDSLRAGQNALHASMVTHGNDTEVLPFVYDTLADDYLHKKAWADSLAETQRSLAINPGDPVAQENLAEAYWGQGRAAEARAQWKRVIAMGENAGVTDAARKLLAAHP